MGKKTSFRPNFDPFGPNLGPENVFSWILPLLEVRHRCNGLLYANSRKNNEQNLRKWQKTQFQAQFWPKFRPPIFYLFIFFFKTLTLSVTRYHGQLSSCTISEKTNDPILRKLSNGRTDQPTEGREYYYHYFSLFNFG